MKKLLLLATVVCACTLSAGAQDLIVTTKGDSIRGKILRIEEYFIHYTTGQPPKRTQISRSNVASFVVTPDNKNTDSGTAHSSWKTGARFAMWGGWGTFLEAPGAVNGFITGMELQALVNRAVGFGATINLVGITENTTYGETTEKASEYNVFVGPTLGLRGGFNNFTAILGLSPGAVIHNGSFKENRRQLLQTSAVALGANVSLGLQVGKTTAFGVRVEATFGKAANIKYKNGKGISDRVWNPDTSLSSLGVSAYISFGNK